MTALRTGSFACVRSKERLLALPCLDASDGTPIPSARIEALGVGKLVAVDHAWCDMEFFIAPPRPDVLTYRVPTTLVAVCDLALETPAYMYEPTQYIWRRGRIHSMPIAGAAIGRQGEHYELRLPNGEQVLVPISQLHVRCRLPVPDPTELLAAQVAETPFFYTGRAVLLHYLAAQREALGGLTALGKSAIELHPHQITVVRRVLGDPIQRYILADEVGLGKTIEAGILARQHLLDEDARARVLVLCPDHLCAQWRAELAEKFALQDVKRVRVSSAEEDREWDNGQPSMLVVDEAHQTAAWAYGDAAQQKKFARLTKLAAGARCVLLLSATPVLHNEDGFFAMLHLLDSKSYPFDKLPQFRAHIEARSVVGESLGMLVEGTPRALASGALDKLEKTLGADAPALARLVAVRQVVAAAPMVGDAAEVRDFRTYVAESYKVHRRLLRTRRDDKAVRSSLPSRSGLTWLTYGQDRAREAGEAFIEAWRGALPYGISGQQAADAVRVLTAFVGAQLSHPQRVLAEIRGRLASLSPPRSAQALFENEPALLTEWAGQMEVELGGSDARVERLVQWLAEARSDRAAPSERAIVFVDDPGVASAVEQGILARGVTLVARCTRGNMSAQSAFLAGELRVLVCDRTVEEGLNLQSVQATLVFFDLPFEPMRLEQRIGRLDRLEGRQFVRMVAFGPTGEFEQRWAALLQGTTRVFDRTIAPLQYILAADLRRICEALPAEGPAAIEAVAARMQDAKVGLDAELRRIRNHELIDQFDWDLDEAKQFIDNVTDAEDAAETAGFAPYDAWLSRCLQFQRRPTGPDSGAAYLVHLKHPPTLVSLRDTLLHFETFADSQASKEARALCIGPLTFDRETAADGRAVLLRIGHPFIDHLLKFVSLDERGTAWALWRHAPEIKLAAPELYFAFDFTIEADAAPGQTVLDTFGGSTTALRRRLDAALAPVRLTIWIDREGNVVTDGARRALLERPYNAANKGGSDTNLRRERWAEAEATLMIPSWAEACRTARASAESSVRHDPTLVRRCTNAASSHARHWERARAVLESRVSRLEEPARTAENALLAFEQALTAAITTGITNPSVRVDAAGSVILAPGSLRGGMDDRR